MCACIKVAGSFHLSETSLNFSLTLLKCQQHIFTSLHIIGKYIQVYMCIVLNILYICMFFSHSTELTICCLVFCLKYI